jgi:hypothetical protein
MTPGGVKAYAGAILIEFIKNIKLVCGHFFVATTFGLLALPSRHFGYATLTVDHRLIDYGADSVAVISGVLFATVYPVIGFILLSVTLKDPIPDHLMAAFPVRGVERNLGRFLAAFCILSLHLLFVVAAGSLRVLPAGLLAHIPALAGKAFVIALAAMAMTAALSAILGEARSKKARIGFVLVWLFWVASAGFALAGLTRWEAAGIGAPLAQLLGTGALDKINLGFIVIPVAAIPFDQIHPFTIAAGYGVAQAVRVLPWCALIAFSNLGWIKENSTPPAAFVASKNYSSFEPKGFSASPALPAWYALAAGVSKRLFVGKLRLCAALIAVAVGIVGSAEFSAQSLLVAWGLYLARWSGASRVAQGEGFSDLERSMPLGGWKWDAAVAAGIAAQMLLLASGHLIVHRGASFPLIAAIPFAALLAVILLRVTKSETPFLIIGALVWYSLISR